MARMPADRPRLFLIDGYSNIFRAFYAIQGLSNSKGEPTNAVYGFINMLRKLLREEEPEYLGVALDVSDETTFRKEQFQEYKANRAPMPEDLKPQIPWIRRSLEAYRIPILELERYEADDVIGTLAKKASAAGFDVVIVSPDKDLMQLVDDHVAVYHTGRERLYDRAAVEEDWGVSPEKVADVLSLVGDTSDNVPGVPLIGDKGARKLIAQFGSLEGLLEHAEEVSGPKTRQSLIDHADQARRSKELVTLHTDLPVDFEPDELRQGDPDAAKLAEIFREMEFHSLLEELESTAGSGEEEIEPAEAVESVESWREVAGAVGELLFLAAVGEPAIGLSIAGPVGPVRFADLRGATLAEAVRESLAGWLADGKREIVGHDLKEVLRLVPTGAETKAVLFDTQVVSFVLRSAAHSHSLEDLSLERLRYRALSAKEAGWSKGEEPPPGSAGLLTYAGERLELPRRLAEGMRQDLEGAAGGGALAAVYREIEAPLVPVLVGMEETGIALDAAFLEEMSGELASELTELETKIHQLAGEPFNLNSPRQLGEVMFERLGYPVIKKTRKTKSYSTDQDTLEELAARGYELPERVLRYREVSKLKSTYVDALPLLVAADGRVHTRYNQAGAATGRLSSTNPNLQNIPIRTEEGQKIRKAFRAPEGRRLLVADYSQIELRVLAHIAQEEALIEAFRHGADIHAATAAAVFGGSEQLVTPDQRRAAKVINFGILYGMSAFGLARNLKIERGEADRFIKAYLEGYPAVRRYMDETVESAKETGKVETLYGRVRWLPDITSRNFNLRENARRMAINARIQGTAADLQKKAMIAVDRRLRRECPDGHLLLTVHDELVLEVPEADVEKVGAFVREEMEGVEKLDVPLVVELGSGQTWYDAKA
jgi:DNA polymerase I